jgi:hypothetical protein
MNSVKRSTTSTTTSTTSKSTHRDANGAVEETDTLLHNSLLGGYQENNSKKKTHNGEENECLRAEKRDSPRTGPALHQLRALCILWNTL